MEKKRLLLITQEIEPYTESDISSLIARLPKTFTEGGYEMRILMPRYSSVNERRHRLHEVVRLSGMNIIVDEDDYPLIIKVASLPNSRLQVYFLDNDEFFKRSTLFGEPGRPFDDNADRAAFFCKGAVEIVKKFGWPPDVILCEGWLTGLIPLYLKTAYKTEPLFANAHVVYGMFPSEFETMDDRLLQKAAINNIQPSALEVFKTEDGKISVHRGACAYADGVIIGSESIDTSVDYLAKTMAEKPVLSWPGEDALAAASLDFFKSMSEAEVAG